MLKFEFQIDKTTGKPTVREAMAYDQSSHDKIWIKFEHNLTNGNFTASSPKYPSLKVVGRNFEDCLVNFQKAYDELMNSNKTDNS